MEFSSKSHSTPEVLRLLRALRAIAHWKVLAELVGGLLSSTMTMARASLRGEGFKLLRVAMFFFAVECAPRT